MRKIQVGHKVMFIGDVHGNSEWDELAKESLRSFYEIVFLGDYVDSFHIRPVDQIHNLKNLIIFLRKNPRTTALLGNHDYSYIFDYQGISGHDFVHAFEYRQIFRDNLDLFKIAWGYTNDNTKKYKDIFLEDFV